MIVMLDLTGATLLIKKAAAQDAEVSFQIFYDQLSPYGHWVDFPEEGYVWIPSVDQNFSPYSTGGYWAFTDYGWTWVSDYPWGWAPFHYGRWDFDEDYGWYWVPDYEWAPAWVAWSSSPGYYGWAPLRPGIEVNSAITGGYYVPPEHWHYVHEEYLGHRDMNKHYAPQSENVTHIRNATMINHTYVDNARHTTYMGGPPREEVEKSTGAPVKQLKITPRATPGQAVNNTQVSIYRPDVTKTTASNPKPTPSRLTNISEIKPLAGRTPSPERAIAPPSAAVPQTEQSNRINTQVPPQTNRTVTPEQRQQPVQLQNAPKDNVPLQSAPQVNRNAIPEQRQQPAPQKPAFQRDRPNRYAPPQYQAPRPNTPVQHIAPPPRIQAPRQAPPQNQRAEPQHQAPPSGKTPHQ